MTAPLSFAEHRERFLRRESQRQALVLRLEADLDRCREALDQARMDADLARDERDEARAELRDCQRRLAERELERAR